ncbi:MAG: hypothetical protein AAFV72_25490 [Cyanobacteria bacterium J06635_1]
MGAMSQVAMVSTLPSEVMIQTGGAPSEPNPQSVKAQIRWFKTLPPERIGPDGEYDYYGLSKRVYQHLHDLVGASIMQGLKVRQRGRVILLSGYIPTVKLLEQLKQAALGVEGADAVETCVVPLEANWAVSA